MKPDDEFLRFPDVRRKTGDLGRTTIWRLEKAGLFPQRRRISAGAVGWLKSEIDTWIANRCIATSVDGGKK